MTDLILPVSIALITAGIIISVLEEWKRWGLTDTSYTSLWCWVGGLVGIGYWGLMEEANLAFAVVVVPIGVFLYWIALKLRDGRRVRRRR